MSSKRQYTVQDAEIEEVRSEPEDDTAEDPDVHNKEAHNNVVLVMWEEVRGYIYIYIYLTTLIRKHLVNWEFPYYI